MREALAWIEFREFIAEGEQFPHTEILYVMLGIITIHVVFMLYEFVPSLLRASYCHSNHTLPRLHL